MAYEKGRGGGGGSKTARGAHAVFCFAEPNFCFLLVLPLLLLLLVGCRMRAAVRCSLRPRRLWLRQPHLLLLRLHRQHPTNPLISRRFFVVVVVAAPLPNL